MLVCTNTAFGTDFTVVGEGSGTQNKKRQGATALQLQAAYMLYRQYAIEQRYTAVTTPWYSSTTSYMLLCTAPTRVPTTIASVQIEDKGRQDYSRKAVQKKIKTDRHRQLQDGLAFSMNLLRNKKYPYFAKLTIHLEVLLYRVELTEERKNSLICLSLLHADRDGSRSYLASPKYDIDHACHALRQKVSNRG